MYTTLRGITGITGSTRNEGVSGPQSRQRPGRVVRRVSRIVITLGLVSFFTDLSSEMVVAVLPVYLILVLGLTPLQYGFIDGLYQGVTAVVRIVGGVVADLTQQPKYVAAAGYGISCACKLLFLPAHTFAAIGGLVALDRSGKGLRTAPRDAMIVTQSEPDSLASSFGVHRAMDTAGALGGPLLAFGILAVLENGYQLIFVLSFSLAAIGVAILICFVPGRRTGPGQARPGETVPEQSLDPGAPHIPDVAPGRSHGLSQFAALARQPGYRRLLAVGALLSTTTIGDGFVYLTLKDRVGLAASWFPLLYVGTAAAYLVCAIPFGRLADRTGRVRVFLSGHVLAAVGYLGLWLLAPGPALIVAVLVLVGVYYAATDGVLPALTAPLVPAELRGGGIAGVQTVMAVGGMLSTVVFGGLWARFGQPVAVGSFTVALVGATGACALLLRASVAPADALSG